MKPTAFSYAEYSKLQIDMERKNEYVNALIAENDRLKRLLADKCEACACKLLDRAEAAEALKEGEGK